MGHLPNHYHGLDILGSLRCTKLRTVLMKQLIIHKGLQTFHFDQTILMISIFNLVAISLIFCTLTSFIILTVVRTVLWQEIVLTSGTENWFCISYRHSAPIYRCNTKFTCVSLNLIWRKNFRAKCSQCVCPHWCCFRQKPIICFSDVKKWSQFIIHWPNEIYFLVEHESEIFSLTDKAN